MKFSTLTIATATSAALVSAEVEHKHDRRAIEIDYVYETVTVNSEGVTIGTSGPTVPLTLVKAQFYLTASDVLPPSGWYYLMLSPLMLLNHLFFLK